jgi:hypothetical protein
MVLGSALMLGGAILRFGAVPLGWAAGSPDPGSSPSPASAGDQATSPPAALASPDDLPDDADLWFADDFIAEGAWPIGDLDLVVASISSAGYVLEADLADLPVVIVAAAGEGSPGGGGRSVTVQVDVTFGPGDAGVSAGPILEDAPGSRLMVLASADGRVGLYRDSVESFDLLASASVAPPEGALTVGLTLDGGTALVIADGVAVTSAAVSAEPVAVGLAVWSPFGAATVSFGGYRVWSRLPA